MAKYVCDFESVNGIANNINNIAKEMALSLSNYENNITSTLSGWTGEAKNKFIESNNAQIAIVKQNIEYLNQTAEFLKKASQSIQEVESNLASLSI